MKRAIIIFIVLIAILGYLYKRQLGAIAFLLLSIFFFILAYYQIFSRTKKEKKDSLNKK
ncbi:hypothetical protein H1Z61_05490 [Bacillus aquiflavi]|uniref:Uncharacterized protein n=1 Tax=Bacillus aquiflavi TaxID=2672567 RepID=A0A6B3VXH2_9BACI|nr:hypothetical protein [Bacillus aquiflavi]MBA4536607.1 hypothetical protein [Bacillus aquiflavi]NEY80975.1 hypothetical protein [Bacillus aquiflavi]UAC47948.1 hypothetical protein K6959_15320 [Bacillus aquiflavi]